MEELSVCTQLQQKFAASTVPPSSFQRVEMMPGSKMVCGSATAEQPEQPFELSLRVNLTT